MIKIYTFLDKPTVDALIANHRTNPGERALQKNLAREVTELVHGRDRRESVERVTAVQFRDADIASLDAEDPDALAHEIPTASHGVSVTAALVESKVCASNGEARRLIAGGGISVNDQKITDDTTIIGTSLIKIGKNSFILVR